MVGWLDIGLIWNPYIQIQLYSPGFPLEQGLPCLKSLTIDKKFLKYPNVSIVKVTDLWEIRDKYFFIKLQTEYNIFGSQQQFSAARKMDYTVQDNK